MLKQRVITAVILIAALLGALTLLGTAHIAILFGLFAALGAWEWSRLAGLTDHFLRSAYVLLIASLCAYAWVLHNAVEPRLLVLGIAFVWWCVALFWLSRFAFGQRGGGGMVLLKLLCGVIVLVPTWLAVVGLHARAGNGAWWVLFLLSLIWVADSAAYFSGKRFGRHKLAPDISPGKTREGAYGALLACAAYAAGGGLLLEIEFALLPAFVALALITVVFSIAGDLFESLMKRQVGVKDSGTLIPGHGGVLDRIDSLTAAAPVFLLGLHWIKP